MRKCISPYRHSYFTAVLMRNRPKQSDCAEMYVQRESAQIHADIACAPVSNAGKSSVKLEAVEISSPDFRFRRTSFSPEHTFPYKNHYYVNYYESGEIGSPAISESAHVLKKSDKVECRLDERGVGGAWRWRCRCSMCYDSSPYSSHGNTASCCWLRVVLRASVAIHMCAWHVTGSNALQLP